MYSKEKKMRKPTILVVDDSKAILTMLKTFLEKEGYDVVTTLTALDALSLIQTREIDLVIMDIKLPGLSGIDALTEIKNKDLKLPVIIMTAFGTTQTAIEAMKRGAYDYVTKPFKINELSNLVKKALEAGWLMKESVSYQEKKGEIPQEGVHIIGNSPLMQEIFKTVGKVADSSATVLIRGQSGTGKELIARAVYQNSSRKDKPFLAVNCAAIPESLLEAELFGHEKGAFTGAINKRIGKFQQCDGGTIFLDEIGDMPLSTQTKILRVLQEHTFEPVGSEKTMKVDVRVIASTNKGLWKAIEKGEFREDLYYRLKVVTIFMPPLRQKKEDIPLLTDYFIRKFNKEFNKNVKKVSAEVLEHLTNYDWPGNVRELENAVQTAILMSKQDILLLDNFPVLNKLIPEQGGTLQEEAGDYEKGIHNVMEAMFKDSLAADRDKLYEAVMAKLEKTLIKMALDEANNNQIKAAKLLGISRNTLRTRVKAYNLK